MTPVPAWTREWRPLARKLFLRLNGILHPHSEEQCPFSKETLLLHADRIVDQLYSHRFVDTVPQDVQAQIQALATKFHLHLLEDRAEKVSQLASKCDYQVLKLLLELAMSPMTATDEEVALDLDLTSKWTAELQQEQLKFKQQDALQKQMVTELSQIATNDEWLQSWKDSDDDESDWEMSSANGDAVQRDCRIDSYQQKSKRQVETLDDAGTAKQAIVILDKCQKQADEQTMEMHKEVELVNDESQLNEILCRYYPEATVCENKIYDDSTCAINKRDMVPFSFDRPWLLCETVIQTLKVPKKYVPNRLIHEETAVGMVFEVLHGVNSLLFEFIAFKPIPSVFSIDFQTKIVKRSRQSRNVALGHISPLAFTHVLNMFARAASELQMLQDFHEFIRQMRNYYEQPPCVTFEGLANAVAEILKEFVYKIQLVEQQIYATTAKDSRPWSGMTMRQPTLLGIYGGLREVFNMISWLKGILMECFQGLSNRHWHEVKRAARAKCVLDALYDMMIVEYVESTAAISSTKNDGSRFDLLLHLFIGTLNPPLDLLNRTVFERGHLKTIQWEDELFFVESNSASTYTSSIGTQNQTFQEGLKSLAPYEIDRSLVPKFLLSVIPLLNEAVASRQLKNRLMQHKQYSPIDSFSNSKQPKLCWSKLLTDELEMKMGRRKHRNFSRSGVSMRNTEVDSSSSQATMFECVPFNKTMEQCLNLHLENKCRELNGEITDTFRRTMDYMEHGEVLRMFVLMEQQDVFKLFSEKLIAHMQENPVAWADSEKINDFFQNAVQGVFEDNSLTSLQRQIGGRLCLHVDFNLLDSGSSGATIDIATMKCLHFSFAVPQPLRMLFSNSILQKYSMLSVFLIQVKAVESAILKIRSTLRHTRSRYFIENDMRQVFIQIADMLHYTKCLLRYLTSQISRKDWNKYRTILKSSRSLAEMDATHTQYLDHLLNRFFLLEKHMTVTQYIYATLNHILHFVGRVDEIVSAVDRNLHRYFPNCDYDEKPNGQLTQRVGKKPIFSFLEHPDFSILQSEMAQSFKEYKRQTHVLVIMLTAMQKHGASPHVNEIVSQLNYNNFYQ